MKYYSEEDVYELVRSDLTTINPTIEITFCRDCKKHNTFECGLYYQENIDNNNITIHTTPYNGYCYKGERKE